MTLTDCPECYGAIMPFPHQRPTVACDDCGAHYDVTDEEYDKLLAAWAKAERRQTEREVKL